MMKKSKDKIFIILIENLNYPYRFIIEKYNAPIILSQPINKPIKELVEARNWSKNRSETRDCTG